MKPFLTWLDQRTGYKALMIESLNERVPGGARWRYVWGSTLVFAFAMQVITGLGLWMSYSPSSTTAWESVYYIQHEMWMGWLLRGIHHFMAQAMIVLMALHMIQVVVDGAYRAPREVNFWLGLILLQIVLGLSLTGYLLPWDQKGYWATKVATNIAGITPVIGTEIQQIAIGGSSYGHHTLTRFFMLHAGLLPILLVAFLAAHVYVFRRHGLHAPNPIYRPDTTFWPDQVLRDAIACLAVLVAVVLVMWKLRGFGPEGGAELGAPANPSEEYNAARPEWYFLFLFQFLKYFPGTKEVYGAIYIPGLAMLALFLMPFIGKSTAGHRANIVFLFGLLAGAGFLTFEAMKADAKNPGYARAVHQAELESRRIVQLVKTKGGIPPEGANGLLRQDFVVQGPKIFARSCASCHRYRGTNGLGEESKEAAVASDLESFGTREWLKGMITEAGHKKYFGASPKHKSGEMAAWSKKYGTKMTPAEVSAVVEFMMSSSGRKDENPAGLEFQAGEKFFLEGSENVPAESTCITCHSMTLKRYDRKSMSKEALASIGAERKAAMEAWEAALEASSGVGPDLTEYASEAWLRKMIDNPGKDTLYPETNAMPAFEKSLSATDKQMLIDWLLHKPFEGEVKETAETVIHE